MAVYVCGDTHGEHDITKITSKTWKGQREFTREDYLIVLGDFAVPWSNDPDNRLDKRMIEWYDNKKMTVLFLPGNHENYEKLFNLPIVDMFGSSVRQLSDNIFMLRRGEVYNIYNRKIFAMGGGMSFDKARRRNRVSWWEEEMPSTTEYMRAVKNLVDNDSSVDYVLTHTCSNKMFNKLSSVADFTFKDDGEKAIRDFFDWVEDNIYFKEWHFGHFHFDYAIDNKHFVWYNAPPIKLK